MSNLKCKTALAAILSVLAATASAAPAASVTTVTPSIIEIVTSTVTSFIGSTTTVYRTTTTWILPAELQTITPVPASGRPRKGATATPALDRRAVIVAEASQATAAPALPLHMKRAPAASPKSKTKAPVVRAALITQTASPTTFTFTTLVTTTKRGLATKIVDGPNIEQESRETLDDPDFDTVQNPRQKQLWRSGPYKWDAANKAPGSDGSVDIGYPRALMSPAEGMDLVEGDYLAGCWFKTSKPGYQIFFWDSDDQSTDLVTGSSTANKWEILAGLFSVDKKSEIHFVAGQPKLDKDARLGPCFVRRYGISYSV